MFALPPTVAFGDTAKAVPSADNVRAVYLSIAHLDSEKKINTLLDIIRNTSANGVVIDFKDSNVPNVVKMKKLVERFRDAGGYTIARIVTFQDSSFARKHPEVAIKKSSGGMWYSGKASWKRYWLDPASPLAQEYSIETAKRAIDAGFDEIQFDYIRFPTDGNMRNISYPVWNKNQSKSEVMRNFFAKINRELSAYDSRVALGIDVFGEVLVYGKESGIGQNLLDIADYFDVIAPMAYPSHYSCGSFGVRDPTAHPYKVYSDTIRKGLKILNGKKVIIRPWVQDFTIGSIYQCGPRVVYTAARIREQIQAGTDQGVKGFMLWNAGSRFTSNVF